MDSETKRDIEDLKHSIKSMEAEEQQLLHELEVLRSRMHDSKERLKKLCDDTAYQQEMLSKLYEQRQLFSNKPKQ